MDVVFLVSIAVSIIVLIIIITWFSKSNRMKPKQDGENAFAVHGGAMRRAAGIRGVRQRRGQVATLVDGDERQIHDGSNDEMDETRCSELIDTRKLGAKKRAKLEAKAERKVQREIEERERNEWKKREQQLQLERDKESAREHEDEKRREEAEKLLREEKARKDQEEYLKLKAAFSVDEEGFEEKFEDEPKNLLQEFVEYVKSNKVVILEDLAQHFGLKTSNVIDRVQRMQTDGILSGVIDDRGKFIYISQQELEAVAKFVKQRGRISIAELAEHSNDLINLTPENPYGKVEA